MASNRAGNKSGLAIASLVCGIIGIFVFSIILGPVAIILGVVANKSGKSNFALAGIILGAIATILAIVLLVTSGFSLYMGG